mgnify:FL=1|jgi:nitroreductase
MKLRDAIEGRIDVKRWDLKKPDWRRIIRAIDAARFGATAGNHFAVRFILVEDEGVIKKLADASQQKFISKAKYVVVAVSDDSGLVRSYDKRGKEYCSRHAGAVIGNFLLGLEEEKLVTSWVWYYVDEQVKRVLGIPGNLNVEGIFPIGRRSKISKERGRAMKLENILYFGKYGERKMRPHTKLKRASI